MTSASVTFAQELRLALWHVPLSRDGPGLLLRDLQKRDPELAALAAALNNADADVIVLTKFDYDAAGAALAAFVEMLGGGYDFTLPLRPNSGIATDFDADADGRLGEPEDAQAYGRFPGQEGLAVLSRYPIHLEGVRSYNQLLWSEIPGSHMSREDAGYGAQRLSSGGHWVVPVNVAENAEAPRYLSLMIGHAGAPVFDGPEDRNGRRNFDELRLWEQIMDGVHGPPLGAPLVFMANSNLDPDRGEGYRGAMGRFLSRPDLQDPLPRQPTAHWDDPGAMRVSYLLPSRDLTLRDARVWPVMPEQDHSLITVDIVVPDPPLP
ncbi:endonuclease/exonuclease/phosphatase family protein [Marivita sp. S2033]|uniref:endonuclease/exonuclease/phosphatase family protein n=1 Tax=Marivita sp. S2033 TaxID=3373187 RepID=UPI003981DFB0